MSSYGNFRGLCSSWEEGMYTTGFEAVTSVEGGWEFLKTYEPPEGKGFIFSTPTGKAKEIEDAVLERYGGHSGGSFAQTMRVLQYIAKVGWNQYELERKEAHTKEQEEAKKNFPYPCGCHRARGLEGWCGVAGGGVPGCDH